MSSKILFYPRVSIKQIEEGNQFSPKFDDCGLIPAITQDSNTGKVLMLGYMNDEALRKTIEIGEAHYFSRSRQCVWHKGSTSGLVQKIDQLLIDDDQDSICLKVTLLGEASCHVGYFSCFYRSLPISNKLVEDLEFVEQDKVFNPDTVYGNVPSPTII